jgi:hypothetical protein
VLPFPLASRRAMIARQSRYAAELNPDSAERFIRQQLRIQGDNCVAEAFQTIKSHMNCRAWRRQSAGNSRTRSQRVAHEAT